MKKVVVIAILAILFSFSAFAQTYHNNQFKLDYPNTWTKEKPVTPNTILWIFSNNFSSIAIVTENYKGKESSIWEIDETAFQKDYFQSMKNQFPDTQMLEFKKIYLGNEPAFLIKTHYTAVDDDMGGALPEMIKIEINCIHKNKLYKIVFETVLNRENENTKEFQLILDTFTFK